MCFELFLKLETQTTKPETNKISRCSSVVEHFLGKEEVGSPILLNGSEE